MDRQREVILLRQQNKIVSKEKERGVERKRERGRGISKNNFKLQIK